MSANDQLDDGIKSRGVDICLDDVMDRCCGCGRWQTLLICFMSLTCLLQPTLLLGMIYLGASPMFKCADGFDGNVTYDELPDITPRCHALNSTVPCQRWTYDRSVYLSTVVTEWDLVCSRKPQLSMLQAWVMIGGALSPAIGGRLSDSFGRRPVAMASMCIVIGSVFGAVWAKHYFVYAVLRFAMGVGTLLTVNQQVITMELCSVERRATLGFIFYLPVPIGASCMALLSYLFRERWQLQLAYALPSLILLLNIWLLPESPRWLILNGKYEEAFTILNTGARWNGREQLSKRNTLILMEKAHSCLLARNEALKKSSNKKYKFLRQLFQLVETPRLRCYTIISILLYFLTAVAFHGIPFDITQLSKQPHLAGVLAGLTTVPSYLTFPLVNRLGRRPSTIIFVLVAGVALLAMLTKKDATLWLVLGLVANFSVSAAAITVFVYTVEMVPTQLRGTSSGIYLFSFRLGAVTAAFVVDHLSELDSAAPSLMFGSALLVSAASCLLLPETKGRPMPETVADVENWPDTAASKIQPALECDAEEGHKNVSFEKDDK